MKKLSKQLFHQHLKQHNKVYTDNIIIDCRNLNNNDNVKIEERDVFTFCREVFSKQFHFDYNDRVVFELKRYPLIINDDISPYLYGHRDLSLIDFYFYIDINILIPDNNEIKEVLDTDLKFDPEKI